jgi:hypothetical protein
MLCNEFVVAIFQMISPCDLEFNRCYDIVKNELQMSMKLAKLFIHLTPHNMRLLLDVTEILKQSPEQVCFENKYIVYGLFFIHV